MQNSILQNMNHIGDIVIFNSCNELNENNMIFNSSARIEQQGSIGTRKNKG